MNSIFKILGKKTFNLNSRSSENIFKNEGKVKTFSDIEKLEELNFSRTTQEVAKKVIWTEGRWKVNSIERNK